MTDLKSFPCPSCQQFINSSMTACKFCSAPLDAQAVSLAIENQEIVNNAYNKASNLRILAGVLATSFLGRFIPFLGIFATILFFIILIGLPFLLIYWQIRFGGINTTDPDFKQARKYWFTSLGIWIIFLFIQVMLFLLPLILIS